MTLDKLIESERKIAEHKHNMYEYECSFYGKETVDSGEKLDCVKEYEYHSQIAELLEELKRYKDSYVLEIKQLTDEDLLKFKEMMKNLPLTIVSTPDVESSVEFIDEQAIRNKAIDEFAERLKAEYKPCEKTDAEIYKKVCIRIDKIAGQIKVGESE